MSAPITDAIRKLSEACMDECQIGGMRLGFYSRLTLEVPREVFDRLLWEAMKMTRDNWKRLDLPGEATSMTIGWITVTPVK